MWIRLLLLAAEFVVEGAHDDRERLKRRQRIPKVHAEDVLAHTPELQNHRVGVVLADELEDEEFVLYYVLGAPLCSTFLVHGVAQLLYYVLGAPASPLNFCTLRSVLRNVSLYYVLGAPATYNVGVS